MKLWEQFWHPYMKRQVKAPYFPDTLFSDMKPAVGSAVSLNFFKKEEAIASDRDYENTDHMFKGSGGRLIQLKIDLMSPTKGPVDMAGSLRDYAPHKAYGEVLKNCRLYVDLDDGTIENGQFLEEVMEPAPLLLHAVKPSGTEDATAARPVNAIRPQHQPLDSLNVAYITKLFRTPLVLPRDRNLSIQIKSVPGFVWPSALADHYFRIRAKGSQWTSSAEEFQSVAESAKPATK